MPSPKTLLMMDMAFFDLIRRLTKYVIERQINEKIKLFSIHKSPAVENILVPFITNANSMKANQMAIVKKKLKVISCLFFDFKLNAETSIRFFRSGLLKVRRIGPKPTMDTQIKTYARY